MFVFEFFNCVGFGVHLRIKLSLDLPLRNLSHARNSRHHSPSTTLRASDKNATRDQHTGPLIYFFTVTGIRIKMLPKK